MGLSESRSRWQLYTSGRQPAGLARTGAPNEDCPLGHRLPVTASGCLAPAPRTSGYSPGVPRSPFVLCPHRPTRDIPLRDPRMQQWRPSPLPASLRRALDVTSRPVNGSRESSDAASIHSASCDLRTDVVVGGLTDGPTDLCTLAHRCSGSRPVTGIFRGRVMRDAGRMPRQPTCAVPAEGPQVGIASRTSHPRPGACVSRRSAVTSAPSCASAAAT